MLIALSASACVGMDTKAKPFDLPVPLSVATSTEETVPAVCEQGVDFILCGRLVQVSYVNSNIHFITAFYPKGHMSGSAGNKNDRNPIIGSAAKGTTEIQLFITHSV